MTTSAPNPPAPRKPLWRRPIGIIAALLGLCLICFVLFAIWSATPAGRASVAEGRITRTARAQSIALAAEATRNAPSATPVPTETAAPPTATPEPSNTPAPTATADPVASEEAVYRAFIAEVTDDYAEGLQLFGEQNIAAGQDATLLRDDTWILRTAASTVIIEDASTRVREYSPVPARFEQYHNEFSEIARLFGEAMPLYRQALDEGDTAKLNEASTLFAQATEALSNLDSDQLR